MKTLNENKYLINRKNILYDQRYTMSRLARDLGVTPTAICQSIKGRTQSLRMHRLIANKLGVSLVEFWPELYGDPIIHQDVDHLTIRS